MRDVTIFVVGSDVIAKMNIVEMLRNMGYDSIVIGSEKAAPKDIIEQLTIDLLIIDYELREIIKGLPKVDISPLKNILFLLEVDVFATAESFYDTGLNIRYIRKPIDYADLETKVNELLSNK